MSMNIKPLKNRVVVKPIAAESKTASGIFIPDSAKEKPQKGTVVAVSDILENYVLNTKKHGTEPLTVLFKKYTGIEYKAEDGEDYLILHEDDILAIV